MKRPRCLILSLIVYASLTALCVQAAETDADTAVDPRPSAYLYASAGASAAAADEISARGPLKLTLRRAVQMATSPEGSVRVQIQNENVKQARMRALEVEAGFFPDIESYVSIQSTVRSLAAQGLTDVRLGVTPALESNPLYPLFGPLIGGIQIPSRSGPFHVLDARGTATQNLFDYSLIKRFKSARATTRGTKQDLNTVDDQVTSQVARAYLSALRADADEEAVEADLNLSQAELTQSQHQKEAGSGTGIDVTRSEVQVANDKQRLLVAKNQQSISHIQLLRTMSLHPTTPIELVDRLEYHPVDTLTPEDAVAQALANRPDLKAQLEREDASKLAAQAVKYERLPTVVAQFDYGTVGPPDILLLPTRDYYGQVRIPIFDGGRRDARRTEAYSQLKQEQLRTTDLRDQIEQDVWTAIDSLKSADEQVKVAEEGFHLAERQLEQARRRFNAGVAGSLEVSDASDKLVRARDNRIQAIYNHNVARFDLGQALGKTASMIP
jgi:outer membrane protein TolC